MACELYCCLLPQCEALRICRWGFPIATPGKIRQLSAATHARANDQRRTFRIMITTAATARNMRLIVETIIASHTGVAYHVEHNFWRHAVAPGFRSVAGVYNLLLLPAALLLFIWSTAANEFELCLWDTALCHCQPTQNTFKHTLRIHSITFSDITIQIVTHRVDWFSCLAFVLLQYTPARPPNLIFQITCGRPQI